MTCTTQVLSGLWLMLTFVVGEGTRWMECRAWRHYMRPMFECPAQGPCVIREREEAPCQADLGWAATICPSLGEAVTLEVRACNWRAPGVPQCSAWVGG